jgi:hypothetical protein
MRPEAEKWVAQLSPAPAPTPPPTPPPAVAPPPSPPPSSGPVGGEASVPIARREPASKHELGVRTRYIFVTKLMLSPYFAANTGTQLNSYSVGIEYVYRKSEEFDIVTSVDFSWLPVDDGNFLGSGHNADVDTHYLQFRNLSFLSADVSIIGHHKFASWFELRYGGGLGVGWVPGDVLETNNGGQCTAANASDTAQCYPRGSTPGTLNTGPIVGKPTPAQEQALQNSTAPDNGSDTADTPHRHVTNSKPPAMAVVNLLIGFRFFPMPRLAITVEVGFRDAMFAGLGVHYRF